MADGHKIRYLNINDRRAEADGKLYDGMMNAKDQLHPTVGEDHSPPPTGDPSTC